MWTTKLGIRQDNPPEEEEKEDLLNPRHHNQEKDAGN